jgi:predicted kinase
MRRARGGRAVGKTVTLARLIHINGAPGTGKTSLARCYVDDHPLALIVDIDGLRTQLGQWDRLGESRTTARELALVLAEAHLVAGHDVVVPQYVGRVEFIDRLEAVAVKCEAEFVEVVLVTDPAVAIERFRRRRSELASTAGSHPEADVGEADVEQVVGEAADRLARICGVRPLTRRVSADADLATTYRVMLAAIGDPLR